MTPRYDGTQSQTECLHPVCSCQRRTLASRKAWTWPWQRSLLGPSDLKSGLWLPPRLGPWHDVSLSRSAVELFDGDGEVHRKVFRGYLDFVEVALAEDAAVVEFRHTSPDFTSLPTQSISVRYDFSDLRRWANITLTRRCSGLHFSSAMSLSGLISWYLTGFASLGASRSV